MPDAGTAQAALPAALARIEGQPRVRDLLARSVAGGQVAHAYLFVGPPGSGKTEAALALAQCIVCPAHGDGSCDECIRVAHRTHPDVRWLAPESAVGYLIDQVRDLIDEVQRAPIRAASKVCVLERADLLRGASANALLKTLEEPPGDVVFILCARTLDAVLPTIASRCLVVPFRSVSTEAALAAVRRATGASEQDARIALAVAHTPGRARDFLLTAERKELRRLVVRTLDGLAHDDDWDVILAARELVDAVKLQLADVEAAQKEALDRTSDFLTAKALKQVEAANKRELTARERSGMMEVLAASASLLRDVLLVCEGLGARIVNADVPEVVERLAARCTTRGALEALSHVSAAEDDLMHNVSPQLACEVMLFGIKEALACPR